MPAIHSRESSLNQPANYYPHVFVTGGTGLVGSHLIKHLQAAGTSITALHRGPVAGHLQLPGVHWVKGDILDVVTLSKAMQDVDAVYHCAATVSFMPAKKREMFKINIDGTANVVNAALDAGVKKMVHVSSVAALGAKKNSSLVDETMNWTPENNTSNYAQSKYLAEMEVWRGIGEGLNAVMVNPTIILGKADWNKGSSGIFKSAYNNFPWYSDGSGGFVDVFDVVKAMTMLMASGITAQRFIVNGENISYRRLFTMAAEYFGKRPPYKKISPFMAGIAWRIEAIKSRFAGTEPLLTKETVESGLSKKEYDDSKLLKYLPGFTYTPLPEAIERVCTEILAELQTGDLSQAAITG